MRKVLSGRLTPSFFSGRIGSLGWMNSFCYIRCCACFRSTRFPFVSQVVSFSLCFTFRPGSVFDENKR